MNNPLALGIGGMAERVDRHRMDLLAVIREVAAGFAEQRPREAAATAG